MTPTPEDVARDLLADLPDTDTLWGDCQWEEREHVRQARRKLDSILRHALARIVALEHRVRELESQSRMASDVGHRPIPPDVEPHG